VVMKSKGAAKRELPTCMGVYRMVDFKHGKPVYKQDGGEHYMYYHRERKAWMVGPKVRKICKSIEHWLSISTGILTFLQPGHKYGWVQNRPSDEDALVPDLRGGWQYQPLAREGHYEQSWREDDATLTVEALGGEGERKREREERNASGQSLALGKVPEGSPPRRRRVPPPNAAGWAAA